MIGVVVWSSKDRHQAIIWCEDHDSLAYLAGVDHIADVAAWPQIGELLELETEKVGDLRCARKVRTLSDSSMTLLPEILRQRCSKAPHLSLVPKCAIPQEAYPIARPRRSTAAGG